MQISILRFSAFSVHLSAALCVKLISVIVCTLFFLFYRRKIALKFLRVHLFCNFWKLSRFVALLHALEILITKMFTLWDLIASVGQEDTGKFPIVQKPSFEGLKVAELYVTESRILV